MHSAAICPLSVYLVFFWSLFGLYLVFILVFGLYFSLNFVKGVLEKMALYQRFSHFVKVRKTPCKRFVISRSPVRVRPVAPEKALAFAGAFSFFILLVVLYFDKNKNSLCQRQRLFMERMTRLELATSTLARWRSTG